MKTKMKLLRVTNKKEKLKKYLLSSTRIDWKGNPHSLKSRESQYLSGPTI